MSNMKYEAGVWDQHQEDEDGVGFIPWSRHSRRDLAERAARKYARESTARTGSFLMWAGGVRMPNGEVYWLNEDGEVIG